MMYDAHCHLSTNIRTLPACDTTVECNLMSTNQFDLDHVFELGKLDNINPCFGIHPWYCHLFTLSESVSKDSHYKQVVTKIDDELLSILPDPVYLYKYMEKIEQYLRESSENWMVGEIGLDRSFRLPWSGFYGDYGLGKQVVERHGRKLSNSQVTIKHQQDVMSEFLKLSLKYRRPVSLHCVKSHGLLLDLISEQYQNSNIPIALHSYSGSIDHAKAWVTSFHSNVFFSISKFFNMERSGYIQLIETVPLENLLLETDFGIDAYKDTEHKADLTNVLESIAAIKNVDTQHLQQVLTNNWARFKASQ